MNAGELLYHLTPFFVAKLRKDDKRKVTIKKVAAAIVVDVDDAKGREDWHLYALRVAFYRAGQETKYGFDKYEKMTAMYAANDPEIKAGPAWDLVSVESTPLATPEQPNPEQKSTKIGVVIEGCGLDKVFFKPEDIAAFGPDSQQAEQTAQGLRLTINGRYRTKAPGTPPFLFARFGGVAGWEVARLGVCVYEKVVYGRPVYVCDVTDSGSPTTQNLAPISAAAFKQYCNDVAYNQAVLAVDIRQGPAVDAPYDRNPNAGISQNGSLDYIDGWRGKEFDTAKSALLQKWADAHIPEEFKDVLAVMRVCGVKHLGRVGSISDDRKTVTLDGNVEFCERYVLPNKKYRFLIWGQAQLTDLFEVAQVTPTKKEIVLVQPLPANLEAQACAIVDEVAGLQLEDALIIESPATPAGSAKFVFAHELGHTAAHWSDIAPVRNLMHGFLPNVPAAALESPELRYRGQPGYRLTQGEQNDPTKWTENQWEEFRQ